MRRCFFIFNLAVFFGGQSPESDISIITGLLTLNSIDRQKYNPIPVFIDKKGRFWHGEELRDIRFYKTPDYSHLQELFFIPGQSCLCYQKRGRIVKIPMYCAINCMHGRGGEDGTIVGLFRLCSTPFVSPDIFASALAMDKDFTKVALTAMNIPTLPSIRVKRKNFFEKSGCYLKYLSKKLNFPMIIKPARLGSSIGIKCVYNENELHTALCEGFNYDDKIICEKYLTQSRDLNCAVYKKGDEIILSDIEEAIKNKELLSFEDKYGGSDKAVGNNRTKVLDLDEKIKNEVKKYSKEIYKRLDFSSIVRFDYLLQGEKVYLNEINAVPGSMAYYLFCEKFSHFSNLIEELVFDALERKRVEDNYLTTFESSVLQGDFKGVKK